MKNFQDILKQRELPYGPLWCDQGVYRIAKEIQLLKSAEFDNIFVGLLVQTGCFGPDTVKAVMNRGHYNRSKKGLNLLLCF